jgi:hypothetical protein
MRTGRHRGWRGEGGQAMVELALSLPLLLAIVFIIVELGGAYASYITLINSAREGARLAARGNIFSPSQVRLVVLEHSAALDLTSDGNAVTLTEVHTQSTGITKYVTTKLVGDKDGRLDSTTLAALHTQATSANPDFLQQDDEFVIVEAWYNYHTITGFFAVTIPMYSYTIMPVSAPS